jgi:hypothetical protein
VLAVGAGHLPAQPWRRHDLARVGEAVGVERAAQPLEGLQIGLAEHPGHVALLVDADAMLARDRSSGLDTGEHDLARQLFGAPGLLR